MNLHKHLIQAAMNRKETQIDCECNLYGLWNIMWHRAGIILMMIMCANCVSVCVCLSVWSETLSESQFSHKIWINMFNIGWYLFLTWLSAKFKRIEHFLSLLLVSLSISFALISYDSFFFFPFFFSLFFFQHHFLCSFFSYNWFFCGFRSVSSISLHFRCVFAVCKCVIAALIVAFNFLVVVILFFFWFGFFFIPFYIFYEWLCVYGVYEMYFEPWIQTCRRLTSYTVLIMQYTSSYTICIVFECGRCYRN